jgi:hypothetical protein
MAGNTLVEALVSREMMMGMLAGYLGMIVGLRAFMKKRAPYSLKMPMQVPVHFPFLTAITSVSQTFARDLARFRRACAENCHRSSPAETRADKWLHATHAPRYV